MQSVSQITLDNDLARLAVEIQQANWDEANEMGHYSAASLSAYLAREGTVLVACHGGPPLCTLQGIASGRIELKPYGDQRWLYIDEVDVCADQRQQGVGRAIMQRLLAIAVASGCGEVWLATEADNDPANALYRSLDPDDVGQVVGYTYRPTG